MAEYISAGVQTLNPGSPIILIDSIPCPKGYVIHRNGSGILTLRGIVNNCCGKFARYLIEYSGNIAIPTGGTVGEISVGLAVSGEPEQGTIAKVTPAAVENYFNVSAARYITVPIGCCYNIALENTSDIPILADEQFNIVVTRTA